MKKKIKVPKVEQKLTVNNSLTVQNQKDFNEKLYDFVKQWEGSFQYKSFCDSYYSEAEKIKYWIKKKWLIRKPYDTKLCWRFSIWYGTISFLGEKITLEEWIKRKVEDLEKRKKIITSNCLTDNQKIVVLDFMYQHGSNSSWIVNFANNCKIENIFWKIAWWRDYYNNKYNTFDSPLLWMVKREQSRLNYFYK